MVCFFERRVRGLQTTPSTAPDFLHIFSFSNQFSSVTQSCLTPWDPMNCSTPGLPVHHQLLEFTLRDLQELVMDREAWCADLRELVMDREAWRAAIHGVSKSRTQLNVWTELNWMEVILQYLCVTNYQILHFKFTQCYMSNTFPFFKSAETYFSFGVFFIVLHFKLLISTWKYFNVLISLHD